GTFRANALNDVINYAIPKFGTALVALAIIFAVILLVFLLAARARGRLQTPLAVLIFLAPALLLLLIGLILPAIRTINLSLQNADSNKYVGVKNYSWAFTDPDERGILVNTILWLVVAPIFATLLGLTLALLIDRMRRE